MANQKAARLRLLTATVAWLHFVTMAVAQTAIPFGKDINWLSGYQKEIGGETLTYFSAFPDYINQALLTRTTDGAKSIEWETAPVPPNDGADYRYFRWVAAHSTGTSGGIRHFDFYINGQKALTFSTRPGNSSPLWSFAAADSTRLTFVQSTTDGANDAHGIAYLRVPASRTKPGEPLRLKVTGQAQQSNDWYMTFKYAFEERADLTALPFLLKDGRQPLALNVLHFGKTESLTVTVNRRQKLRLTLNEGMNSFDIPITAARAPDSVHVNVRYGDVVLSEGYVRVSPVIRREIHFIHHSHTDIGYSHLQPEVERIHTRNIYDALNLIERTKGYPAGARFRWNIESLWAVENFMRDATASDKDRFVAAVKSGGIGLSALYANMLTGLSMPEETFHYTDYAEALRQQYGLGINSAMISDVPGYAWATVTALAKGGVRYFSSGPNYIGKHHPYLGDRVGHFVREWGDKPVWWQSPSGLEKVLLWTAGRGYSSWHGFAPGAIFHRGGKKIAEYLNDLAAAKYPYDMVQWRYNCVADNGPLDSTLSDFVRQWNERYASPKIILNTTGQLFKTFEGRYGKTLPVVKGDITPYWEDGAASTAHEEGVNRANSLRLQQLTTLYALLAPGRYHAGAFYRAWRNILLFHEHTWGAHNSITQPDVPFVTEQWRIKKDFMLHADKAIDSLEQSLWQPLSSGDWERFAVVNTLSWPRSGAVYLPATVAADAVMDEGGTAYPLQRLADGRKLFVAQNLKPLGTTRYRLQNGAPPGKDAFRATDSSLSNGKITVVWDKEKGSITRLEKDGVDFSGRFNRQGLNGYWYVPGKDPAGAVTNGSISLSVEEQGPCQVTVSMKSAAPGAAQLVRRLTLFSNDDKLWIENVVDKETVRIKEAVYFSFPFSTELSGTTSDAGYGILHHLKNQLPGSNLDYIVPRRWLDASGKAGGLQLMMVEPFMAAPDSMVDERLVIDGTHKRWREKGRPTATWFSYAMNNYWHTNYKAGQKGESRFRFALRPHGPLQNAEQEKAAMEFTQPLACFPLGNAAASPGSLFALTNSKVVVTGITPRQGGGFAVRLFNPEASAQAFAFRWFGFRPAGITDTSTGKKTGPGGGFRMVGLGVTKLMMK